MSRSIAVLRKVKAGGAKGVQKLQKASTDEQLLLIHDTEKILGHHDQYFPGGKPLEFAPSSMLPQLDSDEVILHDIVRSRDLDELVQFLENSPRLDINCADYDGNTALVLSVKNGDEHMVELLLEFDDVVVEEALLHAVQLGHYNIVEMLIDKQSRDGREKQREKGNRHSSPAFPADITPIELAAVNRRYKLIKLLLKRGDKIEKPHDPSCKCQCCAQTPDALEKSWSRLRTFEALSSPEYICQTSSDPILTAFDLSNECNLQAECNDGTFREQYFALANMCQDFALDLLSQCRNVNEVELVLRRKNVVADSSRRKPGKWERVTKAFECNQRKFIAHPNCQQILQIDWEDGYPQTGYLLRSQILFLFGRIVSLPILCILYFVFPFSPTARSMRAPINKFLNYYASYVTFILVLTAQSELTKQHHGHRGPPHSGLEWLLILYVAGMTWRSLKIWWRIGHRKYFTMHWHKYDLVLQLLFWTIFALWVYSWVDVQLYSKKEWKATDPNLLSEGIFAMTTVVAFCKLFYFFQTGYSLGPLIVSFSRMFKDIADFVQIFLCVLVSFSLGMARLYYYYKGQVKMKNRESNESSLFLGFSDAISTLFWSIYGLLPYESLEIVVGDSHADDSDDGSNETGDREALVTNHRLTQTVAFTLYGLYSMIAITVLINLLIAMMSNSYAKVEDNCNNEWKFARTGVWLAFMEEGSTLPPPYNLVPTPRWLYDVYRRFKSRTTEDGRRYLCNFWRCCFVEEEEGQDDEGYAVVMTNLVQRYLTSKYHVQELKRLTVKDMNSMKQEVIQTKLATQQILNVVSARGYVIHHPSEMHLVENFPNEHYEMEN